MRYQVYPIADENCGSLNETLLIGDSNELHLAKLIAETSPYAFGAGIKDMMTGEIDVGFGFGKSCPDFNE